MLIIIGVVSIICGIMMLLAGMLKKKFFPKTLAVLTALVFFSGIAISQLRRLSPSTDYLVEQKTIVSLSENESSPFVFGQAYTNRSKEYTHYVVGEENNLVSFVDKTNTHIEEINQNPCIEYHRILKSSAIVRFLLADQGIPYQVIKVPFNNTLVEVNYSIS